MINLDNLIANPAIPVKGFLAGENLLDENTLTVIRNFDFAKNESRSWYNHNRSETSFYSNELADYSDDASNALQNLANFLGKFEVLEHLITKSFEHESDFKIDRFWSGGMDTIRRLHRSSGLVICEDSELYLSPHSDTRVVIANLQIYIDPPMPELGTRFHEFGDHAVSEQLCFMPNNGYFLVNSEYGVHSVDHPTTTPRRSILFGWHI